MRKTLGLLLAIAIVGMMGCTKPQDGISYVRIAPSIQTRVTGLHFDVGDQIGLSVTRGVDDFVTNHPMSYDGDAFAASDLVWYNDLNELSTLAAYYPYSEQGPPVRFSITADQRDGCTSSDLLAAVRKDVKPTATPVGMLFYHVMSQLSIIIANTSSGKVTGVAIEGLLPDAEVDFSVPSAKAAPGAAVAVETCCVTPDVRYRAVLVPQQASLTVCVKTDDGRLRRKTIPDALLEGGKRYDLAVSVTNVDISLSLSGEINDWEDGGAIDGDSGSSDSGKLEYGGHTYATMAVGGRIWMAENLRYQPVGTIIGQGIWHPKNGANQVAALGYLYNHNVATAGASMTNSPVQGVCPAGWHLPDEDELTALANDPDCPSGFFVCAGYLIVRVTGESYGADTKGYLMGVDAANGKCSCLAYSTTSAAALSSVSTDYGISVRCVKDK